VATVANSLHTAVPLPTVDLMGGPLAQALRPRAATRAPVTTQFLVFNLDLRGRAAVQTSERS
jgi:hypothetical protein